MRYLLLFVLSFPCYATVFQINGQFGDGASVTGFIDYEFAPVQNWDLLVTGGNWPAFHYTTHNSIAAGIIAIGGEPTAILYTPNKNWDRLIAVILPFLATQAHIGQTFDILTTPVPRVDSVELNISGAKREIISGTATAVLVGTAVLASTSVPEPSTWVFWITILVCLAAHRIKAVRQ